MLSHCHSFSFLPKSQKNMKESPAAGRMNIVLQTSDLFERQQRIVFLAVAAVTAAPGACHSDPCLQIAP
jgi:hypothetical protein